MTSLTHKELADRYQVIRVLGQGSFGKVFLIRDLSTKIQFAMKKYSKYHILKNAKEKCLIRSSRILEALLHPNIIKFISYVISNEEDQILLIFEACKKGSLEQVKKKIFAIKQIDLIKQIMLQLAEGLKYLKDVSVAHRDIKPSNITFNSSAQLKIIDFDEAICFQESEETHQNNNQGFASHLVDQTSNLKLFSRRSRTNSYVGTEMYMSPEMKNMMSTDERGDVWAYGCILFELVSNHTLMNQFQQKGEIDSALNKLQQQLYDSNTPQKLIMHIADLLTNVLQQNPDKRYSIQQIVNHDFFNELKDSNNRQVFKQRLQRFLRGNYGLTSPYGMIKDFSADLIGMKVGKEKFIGLTEYPILLNIVNQTKSSSILYKLKRLFSKVLYLPVYKVFYIFGGSHYFKTRSTLNQNDKFYLLYDEITSIKIINNKLLIAGDSTQKWSQLNTRYHSWCCSIQSIHGDQRELGNILEHLLYILND